jgi:transcriptional regulator with XRE-family HTH domain
MAALAWHIATRPFLLSGEEVRFLRKYLRMSATDFAKLIGADRSTLSNWENNKKPIGSQSERLIRSVVLALGDGLKLRAEEGIRTFDWIVEEPRSESIRIDMDTLEVQTT